jgi:hypothetical protein
MGGPLKMTSMFFVMALFGNAACCAKALAGALPMTMLTRPLG